MFINITTSETGDNKGSCGALVSYLEKENREKKSVSQHEKWFNGNSNNIKPHQVRIGIDNNIAKLSKDDSKFFLINISPSQKELAHLVSLHGEQGAKQKLKRFAIGVMDEYAKTFKRENIRNPRDLLWFAKVEEHRYYGYNDKEVREGMKQRGEVKDGRQMHVQIIVSRKDLLNRVKLSPQNTSRGKNASHSSKLGQFDRVAFKQSGERLFDEFFSFERGLSERMDYANTIKHGTVQQKAQLHALMEFSEAHVKPLPPLALNHLLTSILENKRFDFWDSLATISLETGGLLTSYLNSSYDSTDEMPYIADEEERRRKKKRKGRNR